MAIEFPRRRTELFFDLIERGLHDEAREYAKTVSGRMVAFLRLGRGSYQISFRAQRTCTFFARKLRTLLRKLSSWRAVA